MERLRKEPADPKSAIYNELGKSLKRVSEINEILFAQRVLTKDIVDRYLDTLTSIEKNFERISSPQEKLEVAGDIVYYLHSERNFLRTNIGKYLTGGSQTVFIGTMFSAIHKMEKSLESFVIPLNNPSSRLYYFTLDNPGTFEFFLRTSDLGNLIGSKKTILLNIDDSTVNEISNDSISGDFVTLGIRSMEKGFHTITLTLPEDVQISYELRIIETEFSVRDENICFGAEVSGISKGKLYKTIMRYRNDFSDNLIFFMWENERGKERLLTAVKLPVNPFEEKIETIFEVSSKIVALNFPIQVGKFIGVRLFNFFDIALLEM